MDNEKDFWADQLEADEKDPDKFGFITPAGEHFRIGPEGHQWTRGIDGRKFRAVFADGRVVVTTNLWLQGVVPRHLQEEFKVRAVIDEIE